MKNILNYTFINNTSAVYYNGSRWATNSCGEVEIVGKLDKFYIDKDGYRHYNYYLCKFDDGTLVEVEYRALRTGKIKNPNKPSVYGVGYIGEGKYNSGTSKKHTKEYEIWKKMLQRCYDEKYQIAEPTYCGVTVDPTWFNFQQFCEDITKLENYDAWKNNDGYELDKDILCDKFNINPKVYSLATCKFVTKSENNKYKKIVKKGE